LSVELPSLADWDILSSERDWVVRQMMASHNAATPQEAYMCHLDGPFQFCRSRLGSKVKRCFSTVYKLADSLPAKEKFDLIYAGDVLLHLFSPLKALDVLSQLCRGSLVVTIDVPFPGITIDFPLMAFMGLLSMQADRRTWWAVNAPCVEHILKRMGF